MRFRLVRRGELAVDYELVLGAVVAAAFAAGAGLVLVGERWWGGPPAAPLGVRCPFKALTGYPCASCGATRAFSALVEGDLAGAFGWNPLFAALYVAGGVWVVYAACVTVGGLPRVRVSVPDARVALAMKIALAAAVLANWAYLILAGV